MAGRPGGGGPPPGPPQQIVPTPDSAFALSGSGIAANVTTSTTTDPTLTTPEGLIPLFWYKTPGASETNTVMFRPGIGAALAEPMPFRGSIVAIVLSGTASKTAGSAVFAVRKNGTALSEAMLTWTNNISKQIVRFNKGDIGFIRDDYLDVVFTTDGGYTPTSTIVGITIWVTQDSTEAV